MLDLKLNASDFGEVEIERHIHKSTEYLRQYPSLIELGKLVGTVSPTALALAVYGWMPRILRSDEFGSFDIAAVRTAKLSDAQLIITGLPKFGLLNNSWVGTSKFLHFLNPEVFPIWDSHIARSFGLINRVAYEKQSIYADYTRKMHTMMPQYGNLIDEIKRRIFIQFGYEPSNLRCLELLIFADSQARKAQKVA